MAQTHANGETTAGTAVTLRGWTGEDLDVFREWLRPHHEWHRWDGPYFPVPSDAEADEAVARLGRSVGVPWPATTASRRGVVSEGSGASSSGIVTDLLPPRRLVIDVGGRFAGTVSWSWESRETDWARMGVTLYDPAMRGRGIGRTALGLWTSYLFARTHWVRLDFATWSGNEPMLAVGRALGFREEARFRKARAVGDERYDSVVMGVLREEWDTARLVG